MSEKRKARIRVPLPQMSSFYDALKLLPEASSIIHLNSRPNSDGVSFMVAALLDSGIEIHMGLNTKEEAVVSVFWGEDHLIETTGKNIKDVLLQVFTELQRIFRSTLADIDSVCASLGSETTRTHKRKV